MIKLRLANKNDIKDIFDLANDCVVRQNSINKEKISWQGHVEWFNNQLKSTSSIFYIAYENLDFIGYVRFNEKDDFWVVSIAIKKAFRHNGGGMERKF